MAKRADNDGKAQPAWKTRMEKMKREGRCVTCGGDKDLIQASRDGDEALEDYILGVRSQSRLTFEVHDYDGNLVAAFADEKHADGWREVMHLPEGTEVEAMDEAEEAEAKGEPQTDEERQELKEAVEKVGKGVGDGLDGRVGETPSVVEATVAITETPKDRKNRLRREKRAAAKA